MYYVPVSYKQSFLYGLFFDILLQKSYFSILKFIINIIDLIKALPGNSSVNSFQYATINEAEWRELCNPFLSNG
jgi:hypothetical protein